MVNLVNFEKFTIKISEIRENIVISQRGTIATKHLKTNILDQVSDGKNHKYQKEYYHMIY